MNTPAANQRMFVGFILNITAYASTVSARLGENLKYVDLSETVRQMLQMYFYAEMLPSIKPTDTYLGAVAVYNVNQTTLPIETRGQILTVMSETQWDLHDYVNSAIQFALGSNVCRESEYYYRTGEMGKLLVYVPLEDCMNTQVSALPEAAVVYSCFSTLPSAKRIAFGASIANATAQPQLVTAF